CGDGLGSQRDRLVVLGGTVEGRLMEGGCRRRGGAGPAVEAALDDLAEEALVIAHPRHLQLQQRRILLEHEVVAVHLVALVHPSGTMRPRRCSRSAMRLPWGPPASNSSIAGWSSSSNTVSARPRR